MFNQIKNIIRNKKIIKTIILIIIAILIFCFVMKNFFPAEWSFITPHKQGDFVRVGNMHHPMYGHQMILLDDGRVFVYYCGYIELYDPKTRKFEAINEKPIKKDYDATAIKLKDGRVLIFGGRDGWSTTSNTYIFDPKNSQIFKGPNMITSRVNCSAVLLDDGRVFISGGQHHDKSKWEKNIKYEIYLKSTEFYNPKTNKFEQGPVLPTIRLSHASIKLDDGTILLIGGLDKNISIITSINKFNFINGETVYLNNLNCKRSGSFIFKLHSNNNIYMYEGKRDDKFVKTVELYDPKTNTSKIVAERTTQAEQITPILLPDDTILFVGGTSGFSVGYTEHKTAQIFDPKTNTFKWLKKQPSIPIPNGAKVLLKDGNVLMTGGGHNGNKYAVIYMFNKKIER